MISSKSVNSNKNDTKSGTYRMGLIPSWLLTASGLFLMLKIKDMDVSLIYKNDFISNKLVYFIKLLSHIHF